MSAKIPQIRILSSAFKAVFFLLFAFCCLRAKYIFPKSPVQKKATYTFESVPAQHLTMLDPKTFQ